MQAEEPMTVRNARCGTLPVISALSRLRQRGRHGWETSLVYTGVSDQQRLQDPASISQGD